MFAVNPSLLAFAFDAQMLRYVVWSGLVAVTVTLLVLMRTRWGQSNPLGKCIVLSLLAHLLLAIYTTTVHIVAGGGGPGSGAGPMTVALLAADDPNLPAEAQGQPWNQFLSPQPTSVSDHLPEATAPAAATVEPGSAVPHRSTGGSVALPTELEAHTSTFGQPSVIAPHNPGAQPKPAATIDTQPAVTAAPPDAGQTMPQMDLPPAPEPNDANHSAAPSQRQAMPADPESELPLEAVGPIHTAETAPAHDEGSLPLVPIVGAGTPAEITGPDPFDTAVPAPDHPTSGAAPETATVGGTSGASDNTAAGSTGTQAAPSTDADEELVPVPAIYQLRGGDHTREALAHGGTRETEAAVVAALGWLTAHQSADGRWDGQRLEAGREAGIDGQERRGAGTRADTGITGLALLSLLASGHTHLEGEHRDSVRRGLNYLLSIQAADGNLGGNATLYEKMYCHAMASFAISEAFAMTHDQRLRTPVRRAIGYTLAAQNASTGGWRYQPGEAGDMSQLGWQFMALKSAELAGIAIPTECREGMIRFIKSVSSGKHGGLASYRPGHRPSRTMTAEALVCRQFLGMSRDNPISAEAGNFVLEELPGAGQPNFYYWYYATLGTYQLQDEHWRRWNEALRTALVSGQRTDGDQAGSWNPDPVWGAYGGRAYSTALGALCLEVYYRFLPFYVEAAGRDRARK